MSFNFSELCDAIQKKQEKVDAIMAKAKAQTKDMEEEIKQEEHTLLLAMQDAGLTTIKGSKSKAEIKESLRISIKDFDALAAFVKRKNAVHLFERRISVTAYREMKESLGGKEVPGLAEFAQQRILINKA